MPNQNLNAAFVASTFQGIQASESKLRISAASNLPAGFVASTSSVVHGIQASESKLRISASSLSSNLQAGFVASTSTESKLRNPCFQFRRHRTYTPASSHPRPRNPSFEIHASDFGDIETTRRLRRIHVHEIQASDFDLCCNRYDLRTIAFLLYTFVGNDGQRAPALTRQQVGARAFSRRARSHLACPLSQSTPAAGSRWPVSMRERRGRRRTVWGQAL